MDWHLLPRDTVDGANDIPHRGTAAGPQIDPQRLPAIYEIFDSGDVRIGKIADVDVITNARAIGGVIIRTENVQLRQLGSGSHQRTRDQMGFRLVPFIKLAIRIGSRRIEVAQCHEPQAIGSGIVFQRHLENQLGSPVRVDRHLRSFLADRQLRRHAIGCAAGRKHQTADIFVEAGIQQRQAPGNIVAVIFARILHGFTDIGIGRTMDDEGWREFPERCSQGAVVENVALDKGTPSNRIRMAGRKIVVCDGPEAGSSKRLADVAAYEAGPARDEDCAWHVMRPPPRPCLPASHRNKRWFSPGQFQAVRAAAISATRLPVRYRGDVAGGRRPPQPDARCATVSPSCG
ncbi:Hypothetical protein AT6N2_L0316 [Agrobacterium tumefaciens]|nr:Hypothetical protein AT6N2_L0316 [Agrobacterium tumefaciens]